MVFLMKAFDCLTVKLTVNVLFLQFHLLLQLCQQHLTLPIGGEGDGVEIIAGRF